MSRRLQHHQRPRIVANPSGPYRGTTQPLPHPHTYGTKNGLPPKDHRLVANLYRGGAANADETCASEDTFTDTHSYYDYYQDHGYQTGNKKDSKNTDYSYSDESDSTRLPYYEYEDVSVKRQSRNTHSDSSFGKRTHSYKEGQPVALKECRKVFPKQEGVCERVCFENGQRCLNEVNVTPPNLSRRVPLSRISDRPQSSQSSNGTSTVVHGCGGKCQTFENVCYYFLQVSFTMGILIGTSLSIAGAVLRKSAARNLQVLVYIGAMLSLVSALLLSIQCSAKYSARKRKKSIKNAKRAPILLEQLPTRAVPYQQQEQPLMEDGAQRGVPVTIIPMPTSVRHVQRSADPPPIIEQPGVPWWRRKDLMPNR